MLYSCTLCDLSVYAKKTSHLKTKHKSKFPLQAICLMDLSCLFTLTMAFLTCIDISLDFILTVPVKQLPIQRLKSTPELLSASYVLRKQGSGPNLAMKLPVSQCPNTFGPLKIKAICIIWLEVLKGKYHIFLKLIKLKLNPALQSHLGCSTSNPQRRCKEAK